MFRRNVSQSGVHRPLPVWRHNLSRCCYTYTHRIYIHILNSGIINTWKYSIGKPKWSFGKSVFKFKINSGWGIKDFVKTGKMNSPFFGTFSSYQLNAHFLYFITTYMLHYNPQHISRSTMLIFRRTNFIITASGIVTLCKGPYWLRMSLLSTGILYGRLQRVTIPEAVIIQFVLLKMSKALLETCWGL